MKKIINLFKKKSSFFKTPTSWAEAHELNKRK